MFRCKADACNLADVYFLYEVALTYDFAQQCAHEPYFADMSLRPAVHAMTSAGAEEAVQHVVDTSIERHVDTVLENRRAATLATPDDYDECVTHTLNQCKIYTNQIDVIDRKLVKCGLLLLLHQVWR